MLNKLRILYYSFLLWWESFGSDSKGNGLIMPAPEQKPQHRQNEKLRRGVRQMVKWMREIGPEGRAKLIKEDANLLMQYGRSKELSITEKMQQAQAVHKVLNGPKEESEESMANTFVKNQGKYRLQAQKRKVYKDLQAGAITPKQAQSELARINHELRKY